MAIQRLTTVEDYKGFLDRFDTFLLDCDGVLWHGSHVLEGILETVSFLRSHGKRLVFVTNNSTLSRANYVKKFERLGIMAEEKDIFSSSFATAVYLKNILQFPEDKRVYVVGESGITDELGAVGINCVSSADDNGVLMTHADMGTVEQDPTIGAVVCGFDINLNYRKLAKAFTYLNNKEQNAHFILTNDDSTFPAPNGVFPGTGSLAQPLIHSLKRTPLIMGKPNKPMLDCFFSNYHTDPTRTCMVGDRLDTDIAFGANGNLETLLVLTGVTTEEEAFAPSQPIKPTFMIQSFGDLVKAKDA
ncbi:hypothetical protein BGW38_002206 [Lunasporangiospora selenospora]|uniref:4-nitrophenylphosphatase n=1 Tax=Lunasporangiospora selenospora TaxID=979761 RepID=A0A9P6FSE2_9FUNG|nr:hypothetical protein BGW38_002206 [Lunasporangiospora selenospora]